ncbi:hypothetical protein [Rhodomicrobium lacus]|uniref:hypothetical protein n=1 Tax=Rhodomicrobium lacus TaxID=2498452 RepID=UPI000F8F7CCD|nr:hypothetical protein [Rhodomicrobium lacus]
MSWFSKTKRRGTSAPPSSATGALVPYSGKPPATVPTPEPQPVRVERVGASLPAVAGRGTHLPQPHPATPPIYPPPPAPPRAPHGYGGHVVGLGEKCCLGWRVVAQTDTDGVERLTCRQTFGAPTRNARGEVIYDPYSFEIAEHRPYEEICPALREEAPGRCFLKYGRKNWKII